MAALFPDKPQMIFADSYVSRSDLRVDGVILLLFVVNYMRSHMFPSLQRTSAVCHISRH
jgi:hypothetical protein